METNISNTENSTTSNTNDSITAAEAIALVRALRDRVPNWGPLTRSAALRLQAAAFLDPEFIATSISAVSTSGNVQSALGTTSDVMQQLTVDSAEWRHVEDEIRSLLLGVSGANLVRNHELGLTALQAYSISRQLVRKEANKDLIAHVEQMKRLRRMGKRKTATAAVEQQ